MSSSPPPATPTPGNAISETPSPSKTGNGVADKMTSPPSDQDCWYTSKVPDPVTGCYTYRTCAACLNIEGCRIGAEGLCEVDTNLYGVHAPNYDDAIARNLTLPSARLTLTKNSTLRLRFPASQLQYCPASDSVCSECLRQNYWLPDGASADSRFCFGATTSSNGEKCVCVANCARSDSTKSCPYKSSDKDFSTEAMNRDTAVMLVAFFVALVLLIMGVCYCFTKRAKRRAECHSPPPMAPTVEESPDGKTSGTYYAMPVAVHSTSREA